MHACAWLWPSIYLVSLAVSLSIAVYAWRRREETSARAFAAHAVASSLIALGALCEHLAPSLHGKLFWKNIQLTGMFAATLMFAAFAYRYTGRRVAHPRRYQIGVALFPLISIVLAFTNPLHGWVRAEPHLLEMATHTALNYSFTPLFNVMVAYVYLILSYALLLLLDQVLRGHAPYRIQASVLLAGALIPYVISTLPVLGLGIAPYQDLTALGLAVGNTLLALGLFRYRLLDLVPLACEAVFGAIDDGIIVLDRREVVVDANPVILALSGKPAGEVIGLPIASAFGTLSHSYEIVSHPGRGRHEIRVELQGENRYFETSSSHLFDRRGTPAGRVIVARDITWRKQAEDALRRAHDELEARVTARTAELVDVNARLLESESRFRLLTENAQDIIYRYRFHPTPGFDYVSPALERLLGISPADLYADPYLLLDRTHPEDRERLSRMLRGEGADPSNFTLRWQNAEGGIIWSELRSRLVYDDAGRVIAEEGIARDISEQVWTTTALRESESRFRALFEKANDAIIVTVGDRIVQCNPHTLQLFDCTDESQIIDQPVTRFCPRTQPDGQDSAAAIRQHVERVLQGEPLVFEWQHTTYTGVPVETEVALSRLDLNGGPQILGLVRNVAERKYAAREVALAREQLRTLSRSLVRLQEEERTAMAREFHDEIGQVLSYQILNLTMLQRQAHALPQATADSLVAHAAESLRIAETLLDSMHRLVMRLRPSVLDHLGLIPALQQMLDTCADPNLTLSLETVGLPPHARFTPDIETALYRVVQEALTNVIRHAGARHVDVLLERPPDAARGDRLILLIEDDGVGFDPESAMRSSRLGLLGMRERVEAVGGTLTLESSPGQGTTILVEVPYAQATPAHSHPNR